MRGSNSIKQNGIGQLTIIDKAWIIQRTSSNNDKVVDTKRKAIQHIYFTLKICVLFTIKAIFWGIVMMMITSTIWIPLALFFGALNV